MTVVLQKQTFNLCIYHYVYAVILDLNIKNFIKYYFNHCLAYIVTDELTSVRDNTALKPTVSTDR